MGRAVLKACLPWLALLLVAFAAAYFLVRLNQSRLRLRRLRRLHSDQRGGVQSLSFVLSVPFFVMILCFIIQVSQLMIGTIVVHYAALAAARSAIVWIPAALPWPEGANCIARYELDPDAPDQHLPVLDPESPEFGPSDGGVTYIVRNVDGSLKYGQVTAAAALACMPISPSRDLGIALPGRASLSAEVLKTAYAAMVSKSGQNKRIPQRLDNKLAYALRYTRVEIRVYHKNSEPPLERPPSPYGLPPDPEEFRPNEIGWQDPVTVTVYHELALLPGPFAFLSRVVPGPSGVDRVAQRIHPNGTVYACTLSATMTLGNEGEKSVVPYEYQP